MKTVRKPSNQNYSAYGYMWVNCSRSLMLRNIPRFLSDRKIIKTEGFEVTTMQSSNLYRNMCDLRPTIARLQSLHWEAFKPKQKNTPVKLARTQPTNQPTNSSTIPWSSELTTGGTLSKANALASLLTTLTVAARGSLRNRARSPKYCLGGSECRNRKQLSQKWKLKITCPTLLGESGLLREKTTKRK